MSMAFFDTLRQDFVYKYVSLSCTSDVKGRRQEDD